VTGIVDSQDFLAVSNCACRQRNERTLPLPRARIRKKFACIQGPGSLPFVDNGIGREITKEEAQNILKVSADAGLVHAVSNRQKTPTPSATAASVLSFL